MGEVMSTPRQNYRLLTLLLFWCALIVVSSVYVTTPLIPVFSTIFQITPAMAAWTSSVFSLFYAIGFLIFGPLADRFGRKQIIVFGLTSLTIITCLIGFVDHFFWLVVLRGIQGFFAASFAPTAIAYVFDVFPKGKLVTAIGFISFGYVTAGIFGQVVAGIIDQTFDWKIVFFVFGVIYFVTALAVFFILPRASLPKTQGLGYFFLQVKRIFQQQNFLLCYGITIILLLTFIGMYTVLGDYLSSSPFHLTAKEILYVRAFGIVGMIISPFTGIFVEKYGLLPILRFGLFIAVIGLLFLGLVANIIYLVIMSVLYVTGISLIFPAIMMLVGELGGQHRAVAAAFYAFILFIGATLGPVTAIALMGIGSYVLTFVILALLLVTGLVASLFIKI
ncbi:MFS transporter [Virgibacillus byunsanensis]|uniref:MFS transporter n=1 Tax=Virgibacillus byunsanensis TaxID=570945 RepID=A0ABW3LL99_9BACI